MATPEQRGGAGAGVGQRSGELPHPGAVPGRDRGVWGNEEGRVAVQSGEQEALPLHPIGGGCRGGALRAMHGAAGLAVGHLLAGSSALGKCALQELLSEKTLTSLLMASFVDFGFLLATPS